MKSLRCHLSRNYLQLMRHRWFASLPGYPFSTMKKSLLAYAFAALTVFQAAAAPSSVRMLTQNNYLPGLPVLVRVAGPET